MATYITTEALTPVQCDVDFFKFISRRDPMGEYGNAVKKGIEDGMREMSKLMDEKYHSNLNLYGLGGSDMASNYSIQLVSPLKVELKIGTDYAIYVEYGTGIVGKQGQPHPNPEIPWQHDINGHGEDGWFYMENGRGHWTSGQASRPFMYETWLWARRAFTNILNKHITRQIKRWEATVK